MSQLDLSQFLGLLIVILGSAKLLGAAAQWIGQPAVLGELVAGVVLGASLLGLVNPKTETLHLLAELGVLILLFEIGLETDLRKLLAVGPAAALVALVGVALPFALGYAVCALFGLGKLTAIVAGATLTATSVGITARVLSDLNRLQAPESQIVIGAAILDDVAGLIILAVVEGLTRGEAVTLAGIAVTTLTALGFLVAILVAGRFAVPWFVARFANTDLPGTPTMFAVILAMSAAWLASQAGLAAIIGAFAAGVLLRGAPVAEEIEHGVAQLGHFFVPIFFVCVGAAVDVRAFNPLVPANHRTLLVGGALIVAAVIGKFLAGYAAVGFHGDKRVVGVAMIPRGEVGVIFAQMGLASGAFDAGLFSAVALMVMATTFAAPPLLRYLLPPQDRQRSSESAQGIEELVTEA